MNLTTQADAAADELAVRSCSRKAQGRGHGRFHAEQTRLADELGYAIAWFAEHHFSNYCLCASPLMMVAHKP